MKLADINTIPEMENRLDEIKADAEKQDQWSEETAIETNQDETQRQ